MKKNYLLIGVTALLLSCNATKNTTTTQTTSGESALIANGKLWSSYFQQNAAEYEALCLQAFNVAQLRLDEALAKKGDKPAVQIKGKIFIECFSTFTVYSQ